MKNPPAHPPLPIKSPAKRHGAQPDESQQPGAERAAQRTTRPGEAGLANEKRPGLGSREDQGYTDRPLENPAPAQTSEEVASTTPAANDPAKLAQGRPQRPEPREQAPNSLAHEMERSTGASGQSGIG